MRRFGPPSSTRGGALLYAIAASAFLTAPVPVAAQLAPVEGRVAALRVEENFRADPNGTVIGRLMPGTQVRIEEERGSWVRATLQGFVWLPSLRERETGDFDLEISEVGGENLRDEASGRVGARLLSGTLLEEVSRTTGWAEVRRTAWVWAESLDLSQTTGGAAPGAAPAAAAGGTTAAPTGTGAAPTGTAAVVLPQRTPDAVVGGWLRSGGDGTALLSTPDGDTLGRARSGTELRVLGREGNWVRVQLDGWVWVPATAGDTSVAGPGAAVASAEPVVVTPVEVSRLTTDFEILRGRLVEVRLQFISLERAEQVRTDFYEGEPFLLTRSLAGERSFVYVAVPPERLADLGVLIPLETVGVVGRLRSGAAAFTGSPIVDLVEIERLR